MEALIVLALVAGGILWVRQRAKAKRAAAISLDEPFTQRLPAPRSVRKTPVANQPRSSANRGQWVPLGQSVTVQGRAIPGGVYVGDRLETVAPHGGTEPALVNPRLSIRGTPDTTGKLMGYWPSYSDIRPESRAAYLEWLAADRPAGAYIGYVFLFFYGIERRVILDASEDDDAQLEVPALLAEVERLLSLYGSNGSFSGYASDFLTTARLVHTTGAGELEAPRERVGWSIPLEVKLTVGSHVAAGEPIPAEWALGWALTSPEIYPRTPAQRCPEEFADLFALRYKDKFGDGLEIKANKTKLRWEYRPASASFAGVAVSLDAGDIPDVTGLSAPNKALAGLVESVTDDLNAYSRYVGRHDDRTSAVAVALLPAELISDRLPGPVSKLLSEVSTDAPHIVPSSRLIELVADPGTKKLSKRDAAAVATLLEGQGVGIEPDVRFGPINFSHHEQVALWRDAEVAHAPGDGFAAGTVLLHLGVTVSASDGDVSATEQEQIEASLETSLHLPTAGRQRLRVHLTWLLLTRPGAAGLKARVGSLDAAQRTLIARYLLAVAGADGHISPHEVDVLKRLYRLLGLDPESVHRDLHAVAVDGPVQVLRADQMTGDVPVPTPPRVSDVLVLDPQRLSAVMASTREVSKVLTAVFIEEEPAATQGSERGVDEVNEDTLAGLDSTHSRFVRALAAQPTWPRAAVDAMAAELGLLASGAIETINEAAFERTGDPVLELGDPIELDAYVMKELLDV